MLITALMGALLAIGPHYVEAEDGTTRLDTNVIQGLDLAGGARILIEPDLSDVPYEERQSTIEQTIRTLRTRVDAYGLEDMTIRPVSSLTADQNFIQMEMAGATTEELREIVDREGIFKASLSMEAEDGDLILLGGSEFELEGRNESIVLGNTEIGVGEEKDVEGSEYSVPVEFVNLTDEGRYNLRLVAYKGEDITGVDIDPSRSGVGREQNGNFPFQFQVSIDRSAAERFRDLAQNFDAGGVSPGEDTTYLEGTQLVLILDNEVISSLNVASVFRDQVITEPSISGGEPTREEAYEQMNTLKSVLESGALPVPISISSTDTVSAVLGEEFMRVALTAIFLAVIGVGLLIFIRYNTPKVALPIIITGFSEVFIMIGIFADGSYLFDTARGIGIVVLVIGAPTLIGLITGFKQNDFTVLMLPVVSLFLIGMINFSTGLDLAAIAGIISAVGTGVDDQIIITDERTRERIKSLKKRVKRAFFIIFTSAASTIGAMIPVMTIGAGAVRGFAITTIIGVIVGISVTRPAYATALDILDVE